MKRVLTALVLVPAVTWLALRAPEWVVFAAVAVVSVACFHEFAALASANGCGRPGAFAYIAGLILLLPLGRETLLIVLLAPLAMGLAMRAADLSKALPEAGAAVLGVIWVFGAWKSGIELRMASPYWLFFALALNWIGDTAAYYCGRKFGRHKLAPRVSPNKSIEGSLASIAASVAFGVAYLTRLLPVGAAEAAAIAALGNVAGQFGDLAESAIKRGGGVKDSGTLLPGHGGWLDRVDSTLFTMPLVWVWISLR